MRYFVEVYRTKGVKILLYPAACSFVAGAAWALGVHYQLGLWGGNLLRGLLFGISFAIVGKRFGFTDFLSESLVLMVAVIAGYTLTLLSGLYFGAYLVPIAIGNLVFSILFFVLDYIYSGRLLERTFIGFYLFAAIIVTLVVYIATVCVWISGSGGTFVLQYPMAVYVYLQVSLICRLSA